MRASVLAETDITDFMVRTAVEAAQQLIERSERVTLSARDSLRVLDLLEHPPTPNSKLIAAAQALPPLA